MAFGPWAHLFEQLRLADEKLDRRLTSRRQEYKRLWYVHHLQFEKSVPFKSLLKYLSLSCYISHLIGKSLTLS